MEHRQALGQHVRISAPTQPMPSLAAPLPGLTVVIQAGGESRRMGRSKALVEFLGEPMVVRGIRRFLPIAEEVVVTTNEPDAVAELVAKAGLEGVRLVRDIHKERGALRGIHTALNAVHTPYTAIIAVDMVDASPELIAAQLAELEACDAVAALPHIDGGYEPFHAVYRTQECLQLVADATSAGVVRAAGWFADDTLVLEVDEAFVTAVVGQSDPFANANTPAELVELEHRTLTNR